MYVLIGANGYMGAYLLKNIMEETDERVVATYRLKKPECDCKRVSWVNCDILRENDVRKLNNMIASSTEDNKVIFLAAYHHPDLVEKNPRISWDINITALSGFLNMVDNVSDFYYPSTDSVYGESVNGYAFVETDALKPVNKYGKHKCVAEKLVTEYGYHVVRFPFLISHSLIPGKLHFYDQIVKSIKAGKSFDLFADSFRSAISFDQAAKYTLSLMNKKVSVPPIVNVCSDRGYSKYEIGLMIADKIGVSRSLINPISIYESKGIFDAKRATSTLMNNSLLKNIIGEEKIELRL